MRCSVARTDWPAVTNRRPLAKDDRVLVDGLPVTRPPLTVLHASVDRGRPRSTVADYARGIQKRSSAPPSGARPAETPPW